MPMRSRIAAMLCISFFVLGCQAYKVPAAKDLTYGSEPPALIGRILKASVMEIIVQPQEKPDEKITVRIAPDTYLVTETGGSWPQEQSMVGLTAKIWLKQAGGKEARGPLVAAVIKLEKSAR